ncbi:MAG TPA: ornithine cyclodeaminase family protein [Ramlibacter sp.]|jgi:ornithine cyclodeaminase|nr:ornithine cyclodeaminase family protein [Ramlibacter sp.]
MIYLTEEEVQPHLPMRDAIAQVERAFRERAQGQAFDVPRQRTRLPGGNLNIMQAASLSLGLLGFKAYYVLPHGRTSVVNLIDRGSAQLLAILEAHGIGQVRTGAATAVAAKHLALPDADVVGMFGSGRQAVTQLEALCEVRAIREVKVYSRNPERLHDFCDRMGRRVSARVRPMSGPEETVRGSQIVVTITRGGGPVFDGRWLEPGTFVAAAGVNAIDRQEIDVETVRRSRLVVDSRETARLESGDLLPAYERGLLYWEHMIELGDVIAGKSSGRESPSDIVLFESHGMAIQDLYCAAHVLAAAKAHGAGRTLHP